MIYLGTWVVNFCNVWLLLECCRKRWRS